MSFYYEEERKKKEKKNFFKVFIFIFSICYKGLLLWLDSRNTLKMFRTDFFKK